MADVATTRSRVRNAALENEARGFDWYLDTETGDTVLVNAEYEPHEYGGRCQKAMIQGCEVAASCASERRTIGGDRDLASKCRKALI